MKAIVAITKGGAIGVDGKLVHSTLDDLKMFKEYTIGKTIVGGRKTFDEIEKPLKGRRNVILSRRLKELEGFIVYDSKEELLEKEEGEIVIIGGSEIYTLFSPEINEILITVWKDVEEPKGDVTYFNMSPFINFNLTTAKDFDDRAIFKYKRNE